MPKKGEKHRKIKALMSGKGVRPPKRWFNKLKAKTMKSYGYGAKRSSRIVGGIWSGASRGTKIKIIKKYQR